MVVYKMNQLPDELLQLIATYLKPVPLAEKSVEELLKMKDEIDNALKEKTQVSTDESQYLVIKATNFGDETIFKINTEMYSKDLRDYRIWHGNLFFNGLPIVCDESIFYSNTSYPKKIQWTDKTLFPEYEDEQN
jgi:hypothetical protein